MNEKIKELIDQAEDYAAELHAPYSHYERMLRYEAFKEKFAELIVRQCDRYARSVWEHGPLLGRDLLIHFGVEEMSDE